MFSRGTPLVHGNCRRIRGLVPATRTRWPAVALSRSSSRRHCRTAARLRVVAKAATCALIDRGRMRVAARWATGSGVFGFPAPACRREWGGKRERQRQRSEACRSFRDSPMQKACDHCLTPFGSPGRFPSVPRVLSSVSPSGIRRICHPVKLASPRAAWDYAQGGETCQAGNPAGEGPAAK